MSSDLDQTMRRIVMRTKRGSIGMSVSRKAIAPNLPWF